MSVSSDSKRIIKAILIGILSACVITALLTCIVAFILKMTSGIPYGIIDYIMVAIEGLGVFIGAYIACMITKSKGLLIGASVGGIALILLLCCGMCISESPIGILTVIRSAVLIILGIAGGILAVNRKEKVRIK